MWYKRGKCSTLYNLISELKVNDKFFRVNLGILLCYFSEISLLRFIMLCSCEVSFQMLRPEINKQKDLVKEIMPEWPKWVMLCLGWCFHDKFIVFNTNKDWVVSLKWSTLVFYITVKKIEPRCRKYWMLFESYIWNDLFDLLW